MPEGQEAIISTNNRLSLANYCRWQAQLQCGTNPLRKELETQLAGVCQSKEIHMPPNKAQTQQAKRKDSWDSQQKVLYDAKVVARAQGSMDVVTAYCDSRYKVCVAGC